MAKTEPKKYYVNMTQGAQDDLEEIIMFIAKENPMNAIKIMDKIKTKVNTLDHFPERGSYVPELLARNIKDYRQLTETHWKIIYKINGKTVNILTIIDSRRNLHDILIRKFLKNSY